MKLSETEEQYIKRYREWSEWLGYSMPTYFYKVTSPEEQSKILLYLLDIESSGYARFSYSDAVFIIRIHSPDSIIEDLENYEDRNIQSLQIHISSRPAVINGARQYIQVHKIIFCDRNRKDEETILDVKKTKNVREYMKSRYRNFLLECFEKLYSKLDRRFLAISTVERIARYLNLCALASERDGVYLDIEQVEKDADHDRASTRLMLATINAPKTGFFLRLARVMRLFDYQLERCYVSTAQGEEIDLVTINTFYLTDENGNQLSGGKKLDRFLEELSMVKWVNTGDMIDRSLVQTGLLSTKQANLIRAIADFVHQLLTDVNRDRFKYATVHEAFTRHPDISEKLFEYFDARFNPALYDGNHIAKMRAEVLRLIDSIDTGIPLNDRMRKTILKMGVIFIDHTLKTNYYVTRISALAFRLSPEFINEIIPDYRQL